MNSITGILSREFINENSKLNILWTPSENMVFEHTFKKLNHNLVGFDHLYFAKDSPHLIICNNKILFYEKCKYISIQFHIPVLLIDHSLKPKELSGEEVNPYTYDFPSSYNIAMNEKIAQSWSIKYNRVLEKSDTTNTNLWRDIIFQTSKMVFKYYG